MGTIYKYTFLLLILTSCSNSFSSSSRIKYDYPLIEEYKIPYTEVFNIDKEEYYIYYYQTMCYHCMKIKSTMIEYCLNNKGTMYFIEVLKDEGFRSIDKEDTIGATDPLDAFAFMTPQLSLVKYKTVIETYLGEEEIIKIINT